MPEGRRHHVIDRPLFSVRELHLDLLRPRRWLRLAIGRHGLRRLVPLAFRPPRLSRLRLDRLPVPFGIVEVVVRLHEVVDRKIVLAVEKPRPAPDNLLELDHGVDRAHQQLLRDNQGEKGATIRMRMAPGLTDEGRA